IGSAPASTTSSSGSSWTGRRSCPPAQQSAIRAIAGGARSWKRSRPCVRAVRSPKRCGCCSTRGFDLATGESSRRREIEPWLPVGVLLVPGLDQQAPVRLLERVLHRLGEVVAPIAGDALAVVGRRVLLAALATAAAALEALALDGLTEL